MEAADGGPAVDVVVVVGFETVICVGFDVTADLATEPRLVELFEKSAAAEGGPLFARSTFVDADGGTPDGGKSRGGTPPDIFDG